MVKENIEDFELSELEALHDAISQFEKQGNHLTDTVHSTPSRPYHHWTGVDLSNIDKTGGVGRQEMLDAIESLGTLVETVDSSSSVEEAIAILDNVSRLCFMNDTTDEIATVLAERNTILMVEMPGVNHLHSLMAKFDKVDQSVMVKVLSLLTDLSKKSESIRDFFEPGGSSKIAALLTNIVAKLTLTNDDSCYPLLIIALRLARTVSYSENNKTMVFRTAVPDLIVKLLQHVGGISDDAPVNTVFNVSNLGDAATSWNEDQVTTLREACLLLRGMYEDEDEDGYEDDTLYCLPLLALLSSLHPFILFFSIKLTLTPHRAVCGD